MRRQSRPALMTRRFSESDSASPRQTAAMHCGDAVAALLEVERPVGRAEDAEVLQPRRAVAAEQPRRALLDDAQAEVLEHRHGLRELDLVADAVQADARQPVGLVAQADVEGLAAGEQPLEAARCRPPPPPGRRPPCRSRAGARSSAWPACARARRRGAPTSSSRARSSHVRASSRISASTSRRESSGRPPWARWSGEVHAHAVALVEDLVGVDRAGVEAPAQEGAQALEQRRVVAALGQRDDDRRGAPVGVAAAEDAPLLGLQAQQRDDRAAQVLGGRGEELVLGEGLEERDRRLVVVRALDEVLAGEDPAQLAVQERASRTRARRRPWS